MFNSTVAVFRKDVRADATVAIELTEAATVVIAGIMYSAGIIATSPDDVKNFFEKYAEYTSLFVDPGNPDYGLTGSVRANAEAQLKSEWGLSMTVDDDGSVILDVPDNTKFSMTQDNVFAQDPETTKAWLTKDGKFIFYNYQTGQFSNWNPDGGNGKKPSNNNVIAGIVASAVGLTTLGESLYDFLHSDDVTYSAPVKATVSSSVTSDGIFPMIRKIEAKCLSTYLNNPYIAENLKSEDDWYNYILDKNYMPNNRILKGSYPSDWSYVDVYVLHSSKFDSNTYEVAADYVNTIFVFCNGRYADGYYACYFKTGTSVSSEKYVLTSGFSYGSYSSDDYSDINACEFYGYYDSNNVSYSTSYLSDYGKPTVRLYNTDATTGSSNSDVDSEIKTGGNVKVGDTIYNLTQGDNIYNNQQYITQQLADATSSDDKTLVAVPQINTSTNTLTQPSYVVVNDDGTVTTGKAITLVNPDEVTVKEDTEVDDETVEGQNIFQLLYNFFSNFWRKLRQVLTSVLTTMFVPDLDGIKNSFDLLKEKFPIVEQVDVLLNKLINYEYDSTALPSFLIKYQTKALDYETPEQPMVDFSGISSFISLLHGIILFICYYCFCKKVVGKLTKVFQP